MQNEEIEMDFEALDALLEAERLSLVKGDLEKLATLLPAKEALIEALNEVPHTNIPALRDIDGKVRRNQLLLDGALEGIRDVAQRISALRKMRGSLETYDADGKKRSIETETDHALEKRA